MWFTSRTSLFSGKYEWNWKGRLSPSGLACSKTAPYETRYVGLLLSNSEFQQNTMRVNLFSCLFYRGFTALCIQHFLGHWPQSKFLPASYCRLFSMFDKANVCFLYFNVHPIIISSIIYILLLNAKINNICLCTENTINYNLNYLQMEHKFTVRHISKFLLVLFLTIFVVVRLFHLGVLYFIT